MLYAWPRTVGADGGDDRDHLLVEQTHEHDRVDRVDLTNEAKFRIGPAGPYETGVLAAHPDRQRAMPVDRRHDARVDLAEQHHARDVDGLGIGDAQAVAELGRLAEPAHEVGDLGTASVHHHRPHAHRTHEDDVLREERERVAFRAGQRVAAVFHDDGAARETADVRKGLDEDRRLLGGPAAHGYIPARGRPAVSGRPSAMLAHWIA